MEHAGAGAEENIAYNVTVTEPDGTLSTQQVPAVTLQPSSGSIWSDYDQRVYIIVAAQNPAAEAQTQMRQFVDEPLLPRQVAATTGTYWVGRPLISMLNRRPNGMGCLSSVCHGCIVAKR